MSCNSRDLTIEGAMADPIIAAAMRADRVDPRGFEHLLRATARGLAGARRSGASQWFVQPKGDRSACTGSRSQW